MSREGEELLDKEDIDKNDQDEEEDEEEEDDEDFSFESSLEEEDEHMMLREDYDIDMVIDLPSLEQLENSYTKDEKGFMKREIDLTNKDENDEETLMKNKLMLNSKGYKKDSFIDESEEEKVIKLQNSNPYKDYYVNEEILIEDKQTKKEKRIIKNAQENIIRQHKINNTEIPPMGDDFKPELKKAIILLREKTKEIFNREKPPRNFPAELDPYLLEVGKLAIDTNEKRHITHTVMEQLSFFPFATSTITKRIKDVIKKDNTKNSQNLGDQKSPVVERRSPSPPSRGTPLGLDSVKEKSPPIEVVSTKSKKRKIETVDAPTVKKNSKVPKPPSPKKTPPVKDSPLNKSTSEVMEELELTKDIKEEMYEFKSMVQECYKNPKNAELKWDEEEFAKITDKKASASFLDKFARKFVWTEDLKNKLFELNNQVRELWEDQNVIKKRISIFYKLVVSFWEEKHMNSARITETISNIKKKLENQKKKTKKPSTEKKTKTKYKPIAMEEKN